VDNAPRPLDLEGLIKKLRSVTLAVQLIPFVYNVLYILALIIYYEGSETAAQVADSFMYVSPVTIVSFLVLSKMLKLCKWHKTACCIPLVPSLVSFIDYYIIELSEIAVLVEFCMIAGMIIVLLISAYKVFLC
jgi:hypothetical protein